MGSRTLGIYLYLYLFLLDFFTYLPFIDVSNNLWPDLTPLYQQKSVSMDAEIEGGEKQHQ